MYFLLSLVLPSWVVMMASASPCILSQSQSNEEDLVKLLFFKDKTHGTYLEIGGFDGYTYSNTLSLHTCQQWNGLLIEGSPRNYQKMVKNIEKYRPNLYHYAWGAVCKTNGTVEFHASGGLTSGDVSQAAEKFRKKYWFKKDRETKQFIFDNETVSVPCSPMQHYLDFLKAKDLNKIHIDFFSLDVEGAELVALESIDFSVTTIDVFVVELDKFKPLRNTRSRSLLKANGFIECLRFSKLVRGGLFVREQSGYKCPGSNMSSAEICSGLNLQNGRLRDQALCHKQIK
jgi:FkbM family methyltransferase